MHLVFSAFASRPIALLASAETPMFFFTLHGVVNKFPD